VVNIGQWGLKFLKFLHLLATGLWIGGSVGLILMIYALPTPDNGGELYAYKMACKFVDDMVVIPGAVSCLVTGFLICLLTKWGFFRHRWVIIKWILTVFCILFGTFYLSPTVNNQPLIVAQEGLMSQANQEFVSNYYSSLKGGLFQLSLIVLMFGLSVFKPFKGRGSKLLPEPPDALVAICKK
jgi:hypothetical protein